VAHVVESRRSQTSPAPYSQTDDFGWHRNRGKVLVIFITHTVCDLKRENQSNTGFTVLKSDFSDP
jgi:hypothetical protein